MICISLCTAYRGEMLCDNISIRSLVVISIIRTVWQKESNSKYCSLSTWSGKSWCKLVVFSMDTQFLGVLKSFMLKVEDQILQHCSLILVSRIREIWTDPIQKLTHFFVDNTDLDFDINPSKKGQHFCLNYTCSCSVENCHPVLRCQCILMYRVKRLSQR